MLRRTLLLVLFTLAGCPNGNGAAADSGPVVDGGPDGGPVSCELEPELGSALTPDFEAGRGEQSEMPGSFVIYARGPLADGSPDLLFLTLWDGYGAFAGGAVAAGTYTIAGVDASFVDCGLCVYVLSDFDDQGNQDPSDDTYTQVYMAESGTVILDSVTGNLSGSLDDVTFRHVRLPDAPGEMQTDHPSNCHAHLAGATFDAPIIEQ
jgi:hypothetical protein